MFFLIFVIGIISENIVSANPVQKPSRSGILELNPRILGGIDAPDGFAPHMVALVYGSSVPFLMCGASIVTKRRVLTAAHCIEALLLWGELIPTLRGVVGSNKWNNELRAITFSGYIIHPKYNSWLIKNDVGVLHTKGEIDFNLGVAAIPLDLGCIGRKKESYVTGWGQNDLGVVPEQLQLLFVDILSSQECATRIEDYSDPWFSTPYDPAVEICTLHSKGHGNCFGDSGSALVVRSTGCQAGIISWGWPCALGAPDMYASVEGAKDFLIEALGNDLIMCGCQYE